MAAVAVTRLAMVAAVLLIAFGATVEVSFREQLIAMARISDVGHLRSILKLSENGSRSRRYELQTQRGKPETRSRLAPLSIIL